MSAYLAIKGFRTFQHYHKRGAPWIKLYAALLSDADFMQLSEAAQAQLMKLWLLASQMGHPLPNKPRLLAGKIGATGRFYLAALIQVGFLIPCDDPASDLLAEDDGHASTDDASTTLAREHDFASTDASKTLAPALARSSPDASATRAGTRGRAERGERRDREERTTPPPTSAREALRDRLLTDADRAALDALLARVPNPDAWAAEISASLDAMAGHAPVTPIQAGQAIRDYVAAAPPTPGLRHFRAFLLRATIPPARSTATTVGEEDPLDRWARETDEREARERATVAQATSQEASHG